MIFLTALFYTYRVFRNILCVFFYFICRFSCQPSLPAPPIILIVKLFLEKDERQMNNWRKNSLYVSTWWSTASLISERISSGYPLDIRRMGCK